MILHPGGYPNTLETICSGERRSRASVRKIPADWGSGSWTPCKIHSLEDSMNGFHVDSNHLLDRKPKFTANLNCSLLFARVSLTKLLSLILLRPPTPHSLCNTKCRAWGPLAWCLNSHLFSFQRSFGIYTKTWFVYPGKEVNWWKNFEWSEGVRLLNISRVLCKEAYHFSIQTHKRAYVGPSSMTEFIQIWIWAKKEWW